MLGGWGGESTEFPSLIMSRWLININVNIKTDKGNVLNNNKIKILKRAGFGYKDFKFLRGRILYSFTGILSCSTRNKNTFKSKNNK